jgi:hypothetical protein
MKTLLLTLSLFFVSMSAASAQDCGTTCRPVAKVLSTATDVAASTVSATANVVRNTTQFTKNVAQAALQAPKAVVSSVRYNSCGCKRGLGLLRHR